jgi:hypothetical protein
MLIISNKLPVKVDKAHCSLCKTNPKFGCEALFLSCRCCFREMNAVGAWLEISADERSKPDSV